MKEAGGKEIPGAAKHHAPASTNVIDLVAVLQKSLAESGAKSAGADRLKRRAPAPGKRATGKTPAKKRGTHRHAA